MNLTDKVHTNINCKKLVGYKTHHKGYFQSMIHVVYMYLPSTSQITADNHNYKWEEKNGYPIKRLQF